MMPFPDITVDTTTHKRQNICTMVHIPHLPLADLKFRPTMS